MQTIWDWLTIGAFGALAVLFLNRSIGPAVAGDRVVAYLPPAIACAAADQLGNAGRHGIAAAALAFAVGYALMVLRPFR